MVDGDGNLIKDEVGELAGEVVKLSSIEPGLLQPLDVANDDNDGAK